MRFSFPFAVAAVMCVASFSAGAACAQTDSPTVPARTAPASSILSVPLPPQARLRFDMDARDEDLLGVVKSLLRGFNGRNLKQLLPPGSPDPKAPAAALDLEKAAIVQLLSDADLETLLHDVKHLRLVAFEVPYVSRWSAKPAKPVAPRQGIVAFYEDTYITRGGGRKLVRADFDDVQLLVVGFGEHGFGVVMQAPGFGGVLRADGYPDLDGVGPLVMGSALQLSRQLRPSR